MSATTRLPTLEDHRLDGATISAGCFACPLLRECGGLTQRAAVSWSCMDGCHSCDKSKCDLVCLKKPADFARALLEVGGFELQHAGQLTPQPDPGTLPRYVPTLQHTLDGPVPLDWVAVPLKTLMRFSRGFYAPCATSGPELRRLLGVGDRTRLILLGPGRDRPIESYWRWRRHFSVPEALGRLGLEFGISPNYSMWLNEPRTQHLYNRKRSLLCAVEWASAGVPAVPYLAAVSRADFDAWEEYLREHPEITTIAEEFQTGLSSWARGEQTIAWLARVQERLRRRIHPIAVGGARYAGALAARFDSWTVIDSEPFMRAVHWRMASAVGRRVTWIRSPYAEPADLFFQNARRYAEWVTSRR